LSEQNTGDLGLQAKIIKKGILLLQNVGVFGSLDVHLRFGLCCFDSENESGLLSNGTVIAYLRRSFGQLGGGDFWGCETRWGETGCCSPRIVAIVKKGWPLNCLGSFSNGNYL